MSYTYFKISHCCVLLYSLSNHNSLLPGTIAIHLHVWLVFNFHQSQWILIKRLLWIRHFVFPVELKTLNLIIYLPPFFHKGIAAPTRYLPSHRHSNPHLMKKEDLNNTVLHLDGQHVVHKQEELRIIIKPLCIMFCYNHSSLEF